MIRVGTAEVIATGTAKVIGPETAKVIVLGTAKVILGPGTAKVIFAVVLAAMGCLVRAWFPRWVRASGRVFAMPRPSRASQRTRGDRNEKAGRDAPTRGDGSP